MCDVNKLVPTGEFRVAFRLCFKVFQSVNKTNFHMKGFGLGLRNATRKSPIVVLLL